MLTKASIHYNTITKSVRQHTYSQYPQRAASVTKIDSITNQIAQPTWIRNGSTWKTGLKVYNTIPSKLWVRIPATDAWTRPTIVKMYEGDFESSNNTPYYKLHLTTVNWMAARFAAPRTVKITQLTCTTVREKRRGNNVEELTRGNA